MKHFKKNGVLFTNLGYIFYKSLLMIIILNRIPSIVHRRTMGQAENVTKESEIHQMGTTARIVPTHNLHAIGIDRTSLRAPIYRKYVKRREKIETTKYRETSIQVYLVNCQIMIHFLLINHYCFCQNLKPLCINFIVFVTDNIDVKI